jgi:hypothetical protein
MKERNGSKQANQDNKKGGNVILGFACCPKMTAVRQFKLYLTEMKKGDRIPFSLMLVIQNEL